MSLDVGLYYEVEPNKRIYVFEANITHNLGRMAYEAKIYECLWRPEDLGINKAKDLIKLLEKGLLDMKSRYYYYKQFNSENGWGVYEDFVLWIEEYLNACKEYPNANISISR